MKPEYLMYPSLADYMLDVLSREQLRNPTELVILRTSETGPERSLTGHIASERLPLPPSLAINLAVQGNIDGFPMYACQFRKRGNRYADPIFFISAITADEDKYALRMFRSSEQSDYRFLPIEDKEEEPVTLRLWTPEWIASTVRYPHPPVSAVDTASLRTLARTGGYPDESQIPTVALDPKHTLDRWVAVCASIFMHGDFRRPGKLPPFVVSR